MAACQCFQLPRAMRTRSKRGRSTEGTPRAPSTAGCPGRRTRRGRLGPTWRRRRGRNTDLKLAHEPQQVRSLKSQRSRGSRAIAADLRQRRLDQATLEVADGTVKADGRAGRGRSDNRLSCHDRLREAVSRNLGRTRGRQRSHERVKGKGSATNRRNGNSRRYGSDNPNAAPAPRQRGNDDATPDGQ